MVRFAWAILAVLAILWVLAMVVGMVAAFPFGLVGLAALLAFGILFFKVLGDRLENEEDDYYSKNVDE